MATTTNEVSKMGDDEVMKHKSFIWGGSEIVLTLEENGLNNTWVWECITREFSVSYRITLWSGVNEGEPWGASIDASDHCDIYVSGCTPMDAIDKLWLEVSQAVKVLTSIIE